MRPYSERMASTEPTFLFMFGFESPGEHVRNERNGWDDESSWAVWIAAASSDAALTWGRQIAEDFVRQLFVRAGVAPRSWMTDDFAHWISAEESELQRARLEDSIPTVADGQMPDLSSALDYWSGR
ncbi:MAG: hypothetical protein H7124_15285 [Phycisphaerales bacterium]|nr:hypothetical protein [Hyphomonadaceae bacterium]